MYTSVVFHFDFVSMGIMQANNKKCDFTDIERHLEKKKHYRNLGQTLAIFSMPVIEEFQYLINPKYWIKQNANNPRVWHQNHSQWSNLKVIWLFKFILLTLVDVTQTILSLFYLWFMKGNIALLLFFLLQLFIANVVLGCEKHDLTNNTIDQYVNREGARIICVYLN